MKVLLAIQGDYIAPRFDLTTEVVIAVVNNGRLQGEPSTLLLSGASGEELCGLIVKEDISTLICGGIEESQYEYLVWKKLKVIDMVVGPCEQALQFYLEGGLEPGTILPGAADRKTK